MPNVLCLFSGHGKLVNLFSLITLYCVSISWNAEPARTFTGHFEDFLYRSAPAVEATNWDGNQIS